MGIGVAPVNTDAVLEGADVDDITVEADCDTPFLPLDRNGHGVPLPRTEIKGARRRIPDVRDAHGSLEVFHVKTGALVGGDEAELGIELDVPVPGGEAVALMPPMVLGQHPPIEDGKNLPVL